MNAFDKTYQEMLKRIMKEGVTEVNKRTGHEVKAIPGLHFSHDIGRDGFPLLTLRKIPIKMFVAEQIWFVSGSRKPAPKCCSVSRVGKIRSLPGCDCAKMAASRSRHTIYTGCQENIGGPKHLQIFFARQ
jgi:hypothetical protein